MDISTRINETQSVDDKVVSSLSPSIENKQNKRSIFKSPINRIRFSSSKPRLEQEPNTLQKDVDKSQDSYLNSQERIAPSPSSQIKQSRKHPNRFSVGENKLNEIVQDLKEIPIEEEAFEEQKIPITSPWKWVHSSRHFIMHMMEQPNFHYTIIVLIIVDLIIVFIELVLAQLSLPCLTDNEMLLYNTTVQRKECLLPPTSQLEAGETTIYYFSLVLISIFVVEILSAFYAFGWRRYTKLLYLLDAIIVLVSFVLEVYFHFGNVGKVGRAAAGLVVLRLWKIIRAIHAIAHSMSLRNHMIVTEINKAREMLNEEKLQAEETIHQQQVQIEHLKNMLEKNDKQNTPDQINVLARSRGKSLDSTTSF